MKCGLRLPFVLWVVMWLAGPVSAQGAAPGDWVTTGRPNGLLAGDQLIALADGTVLLFGVQMASVQQYHPETGDWSVKGSFLVRRGLYATVTLLPSGLVLVAGGLGNSARVAELYDPRSGTSRLTGSMHHGRSRHRATLLASGKVLVSGGGTDEQDQLVVPAEIYDPATGTWSLTGALNQPRSEHFAARLPNGNVLVAGGRGPLGALASAELYDAVTGTWTYTDSLDLALPAPLGLALNDGRVLVAGSIQQISGFLISHVSAGQLYDPASGTWTSGVTVQSPLGLRGLVALGDGTSLLVLGGCSLGGAFPGGCGLSHYVTFDVQTGAWSDVARIDLSSDARDVISNDLVASDSAGGAGDLVSAALLADGRALFMGGPLLFRPDDTTPRLVVSPENIDFGKLRPGTVVQRSVQVRNAGGSTLTGGAAATGSISVVSGSPFVLAPGETTAVTIEHTAPSGVGLYSGGVQFKSNGNWSFVSTQGRVGLLLSGRIIDATGAGVGGVLVELAGGTVDTAFTDQTGRYVLIASGNTSYTVTPRSAVRTFTPSIRFVNLVTQDVGGLDFTTPFTPAQLGVARDGTAFLDLNSNAQWDGCDVDGCRPFGVPGEKIVVGSWSLRGKQELAVFRDGAWVLDRNGNGIRDECQADRCVVFGLPGDVPVAGSWIDGGGTSVGVFRAGQWLLDLNVNGQFDGCDIDACLTFGQPGDVPAVGAWTTRGEVKTERRAKVGVFRDGLWLLDLNGNGRWDGCEIDACLAFGQAGDVPVVGDWTGTGQARIGVFRDGQWFVDRNSNGQWDGCDVDACFQFGAAGDAPLVGNW